MISENLRGRMGGYGSGRRGGKPTTDGYLFLDVRRLHRLGYFTNSLVDVESWSCAGEVVASVGLEAGRTGVMLTYLAEGEPRRYTVSVEWTRCSYGGERPWWRCPSCGRRCAVLFGRRRFACRQCHGLVYQSQRETRADRLMRKADKVRQRLRAGSCGEEEKPKGMHWRTFERLTEAIDLADHESLILAVRSLGGGF